MRTTLFVAATAVFVAGCSGGDAPERSPAPSSPRSSASTMSTVSAPRTGPLTTGAGVLPGEKPPVEPAIAKTHTDDGAFAFAAYYLRALDWSLATTDVFLLDELSDLSCGACRQHISGIANLAKSGSRVIGGRSRLISEKLIPTPSAVDADLAYRVSVLQDAATVVTPTGAITQRQAAGEKTINLYLKWNSSVWRIVEIGS